MGPSVLRFFLCCAVLLCPAAAAKVKSLMFGRLVKVTHAKCVSDNLEAFQFDHCGLVSNEKGNRLLIIGHVLERPVRDATLRIRMLRKQQGEYVPLLLDFTIDFCAFMSKDNIKLRNDTFISQLYTKSVQKYSNIDAPCPINDEYKYLNYTLDQHFMASASMPGPRGDQRIEVNVLFNQHSRLRFSVDYQRK